MIQNGSLPLYIIKQVVILEKVQKGIRSLLISSSISVKFSLRHSLKSILS